MLFNANYLLHLELKFFFDSSSIELLTKKHYRSGSATGGTLAKDAAGNDVIAAEWLKTHGPGDRTLTQGLKVSV
jgi:hypothetical protein